jgi:hypothetical protein
MKLERKCSPIKKISNTKGPKRDSTIDDIPSQQLFKNIIETAVSINLSLSNNTEEYTIVCKESLVYNPDVIFLHGVDKCNLQTIQNYFSNYFTSSVHIDSIDKDYDNMIFIHLKFIHQEFKGEHTPFTRTHMRNGMAIFKNDKFCLISTSLESFDTKYFNDIKNSQIEIIKEYTENNLINIISVIDGEFLNLMEI